MKDHGPAPSTPSADPRFGQALAHYNQGEFFEAHEVWESLWHALAVGPVEVRERPGGDRRFVQGLIQLAVSFEHWRRGNPRGARGQWEKAREKLEACASPRDGIDLSAALSAAAAFYAARNLTHAEEQQRAGTWKCPAHEPYPGITGG
ncbi:MAG: DUF309 domain-containing protein [Myxococcales bacterium]|nr:DUF309 domain-containing protein [Myxococcales bacterium]